MERNSLEKAQQVADTAASNYIKMFCDGCENREVVDNGDGPKDACNILTSHEVIRVLNKDMTGCEYAVVDGNEGCMTKRGFKPNDKRK